MHSERQAPRGNERGAYGGLQRAQSTLEYAILVAVVAAALVAMHTYVRRAMQANLTNLELELNAVAAE